MLINMNNFQDMHTMPHT